jgi:hypothetical protein
LAGFLIQPALRRREGFLARLGPADSFGLGRHGLLHAADLRAPLDRALSKRRAGQRLGLFGWLRRWNDARGSGLWRRNIRLAFTVVAALRRGMRRAGGYDRPF